MPSDLAGAPRLACSPGELPLGPFWVYGSGGGAQTLFTLLGGDALPKTGRVLGILDSSKSGTLAGHAVHVFDADMAGRVLASKAPVVVASSYREQIVHGLRCAGLGEDRIVVFFPRPRHLAEQLLQTLPEGERLLVLDIGARDMDRDMDAQWRGLPPRRVALAGFEPDQEECGRIRTAMRAQGYACTMFPTALWGRRTQVDFHIMRPPHLSSCFPANTDLAVRLRNSMRSSQAPVAEDVRLDRVVALDGAPLADFADSLGAQADFAKLDVQGAEFEVLLGAGAVLDGLLGLKLEIWFQPLYRNAPLFPEIASWLMGKGFRFFSADLSSGLGRAASPVCAGLLAGSDHSVGQVLTSDAVFFRDPLDWPHDDAPLPPERLLRLASLAECYGQLEFGFEVALLAIARARETGREGEALAWQAAVDRAADAYNAARTAS